MTSTQGTPVNSFVSVNEAKQERYYKQSIIEVKVLIVGALFD